jgi:2-amino-4-hydroxy-6-hydroxymethyldihydropteridine diphosphokinase
MLPSSTILLGLGSNLAGPWGESPAILARTLEKLTVAGLRILACSSFYATQPVGIGRQPTYVNAVVMAKAPFGPAKLLRTLKRIERCAGRRLGRHWGPRQLDIDILDFGGRRIGQPRAGSQRRPGQLRLPHPEMHRRAFVLLPLHEIAPSWRHPRLGLSAATLMSRLPARDHAGVRRVLDSPTTLCEKRGE